MASTGCRERVSAQKKPAAAALLPDDGARIQGPTFEEWLASDDAAALPV